MKGIDHFLSQQLLRKIAIRHRLIGALALLSLLPVLVSGYIAFIEASRAIQEKTRVFSSEVVKQVARNVQLQITHLEMESERLVLSDRVQDDLTQVGGEDDTAKSVARADLTHMLLERYGSFDYVNQKYLLDRDNHVLDGQVFDELANGVVAFAAQAPDVHGSPYWGVYKQQGGQKSVVMLRAIYSKNDNHLLGKLFLGIEPRFFSSIFDDVDLGRGTDLFVLDGKDGAILVKSQEGGRRAAGERAEQGLINALARAMLGGEHKGFISFDNKDKESFLAAFANVPNTNWTIVSTIPVNNLTVEARSAGSQIALIGLLCFVVSIVLSSLIARSISLPLERLVHSMRVTGTRNYASRAEAGGNDELTALAVKFNDMAAEVDQHNVELELRVAERTAALEAANAKLAELSLTDSLTGIANRRRFDDALPVELKRATRSQSPLALMMIDVDFFKNFNDLYGHHEGDGCLRRVARLLQAHSRRASDLVARYGGEEFVIIAADTDGEAAFQLADTIRRALETLAMPHAGSPLGMVSCSIGVASLVPDDDLTPEMMVRMADKAMYRAKEGGRNQVVLAGRKTPA